MKNNIFFESASTGNEHINHQNPTHKYMYRYYEEREREGKRERERLWLHPYYVFLDASHLFTPSTTSLTHISYDIAPYTSLEFWHEFVIFYLKMSYF